jgi:phenylpropionate dioxygenase-like ring-hydroxylating dioxygenase large terminal subunit
MFGLRSFTLDLGLLAVVLSVLGARVWPTVVWAPWAGLGAALVLALLVRRLGNGQPRSAESEEGLKYSREFLDRARNVKLFPPPYPNTWYQILRSDEVQRGEVKALQLLGKELVAFRDHAGVLGILDAFCPHLGAHLGKGGVVNAAGHLKCPFHEWTFGTDGKCQSIPYCTKDIGEYSHINQGAYRVLEKFGLVFMWYHSDGEPPRFSVDMHVIEQPCLPCDSLIRKGSSMLFNMHMMEPSLNTQVSCARPALRRRPCLARVSLTLTQDWYHFSTTHANYPGFAPLKLFHTVRDTDFRDDGTFSFFEDMDASMFGLPRTRLPRILNKVNFCGPAVAVIVSQFCGCSNTTFATFTPISPFRTKVTFTSFSSGGLFGLWKYASLLVAHTVEHTVRQDLTVWEHKSNPAPKRLVAGDRPGFLRYHKWFEQFFTESSKLQKTLDW